MARFNAAVERFSSSSVEDEKGFKRKLTKLAKGAVAATGVSAVAVFGMAPAQADEVVVWGGMGDPSGQNYENTLRSQGQVGPDDTVHKVPYPASIWPLGPQTLEQSVNEGVANGRGVVDGAQRAAAPGEKVVIRGYSEGGIPAAIVAGERSGGGPVAPGTVIMDGSPVSSTGLFANQDPLVQMGLGIAGHFGIPTHHRAPAGSEVRGSEQDVWAYGGQSSIGQLIPQAMNTFMGPAHAVQDPQVPGARTWVGPDGIVQVQWPGLGTGGPAPAGVTMGGPAVQAPAPAPAPEARPAPNSPNFKAVSRDWKERHGMELNGSENSGKSNRQNVIKSLQQNVVKKNTVDRTERSTTLKNGTKKVSAIKKNSTSKRDN